MTSPRSRATRRLAGLGVAMVKKLAALDLRSTSRTAARADRAGERVAIEVIRHHRLLELYLAKTLGLDVDAVHDEADRLEHVISEELEERIDRALGYPTHDPHGDPIPDADACELAELQADALSESEEQRSSGPSSSSRRNGFDRCRPAVVLGHDGRRPRASRSPPRARPRARSPRRRSPPRAARRAAGAAGSPSRPTAQTAPVRRSIQITMRSSRSRVVDALQDALGEPRRAMRRFTAPSIRIAARGRLRDFLRNPFSFLFARSRRRRWSPST